jgi:protein TonB
VLVQQFEIENHQRENKNRMGGWTVTIAVHALVLLALFYIYITPPNPPYEDNAGGMTVNYGTSAVGSGDQQQFTAVPVTVQQDVPSASSSSASSSQENLETQNTEDAASVDTKKKPVKPKDKTNPDALLKPQSKPVASNTPPTPKANQNALFHPGAIGKPNNSKGDGEGHGQGDQGDPNGDPNSHNYHGGGNGNGLPQGGNGIGNGHFNLKGRKRIYKPNIINPCADSRGKITITIQVNKAGKVINAKFSQAGSTTADDCLINLSKKEAMQWGFDQKADADDVQTGSILFEYGYK